MTAEKYIGNKKRELGGNFLGACSSPSRGFAGKFLAGIEHSAGDIWAKRLYKDLFSISFDERNLVNSARRSFEAKNHDIHIFFTGDALNLEELRQQLHKSGPGKDLSGNPAQISVRLYQRYGLQFPSMINGFFSICMWNRSEKSLAIYADSFGSAVPVYYFLRSNGLIFSSQLKMLARVAGRGTDIDPTSLAIFLKYSYVPAPRTILRSVFKLGPGEMLIYKNAQMTKQRYAQFNPETRLLYDEPNAVEQYLDVLSSSIRNKAKGAEGSRIGFFLSGGLDSSANVAIASRSGIRNFKTFGIGFEDPKIDERPYARFVAKHFGVPFHEYVFDGSEMEDLPRMVWHLDEPFMENGLFLTYAGFKAAKGQVDLMLAGDGADQLFGTGGFAEGRPIALRYLLEKFRLRKSADIFRRVFYNRLFYKDNFFYKFKVMLDRSVDFNDWFFWGFDDNELAQLCRFSIQEDSLSCFSNDLHRIPKTLASYYHHALTIQDLEHYAFQNVLFKSFRMANMFGIKLRETYLDKGVIEFVLSTHFSLKGKGSLWNFLMGKGVTKYLHRLSTKRILPSEVFNKPKQGGFVPMTLLFKNLHLRRYVFNYLTYCNPLKDYLNMPFLKALLKDYEQSLLKAPYWQAHQEAKTNQIMNILTLCLWYEIIGKGQFSSAPKDSLSKFIRH